MTAAPARALRPTTIIPESLYVERAADRQLAQAIEDMGRPGYVLVARQMGKTNLLLNMKRKQEREGNIVLYVDLTARFPNSRALFRHVVDGVVEIIERDNPGIGEKIEQQRNQGALEPNVEFDRHIRHLLRSAPDKKFIIVFDEIDSLINVSFSDVILAQIRSMYFSRINHEEYNRMTYVLSGVAEPTDLIKDKNISPFNIGEKIYLSDFTMGEVQNFLSLAGLVFGRDVVDRIYEWTGGNPRITWDVCSELEVRAANSGGPSAADVDAAVKKLYLDRFDRPPVDHIRVLVESDPLVRDAIVTIRYGKGHTLDERVKSRLYLSGITSGDLSSGPFIKNKIVDQALSDNWLNQVTAGDRDLLRAASESIVVGKYDQAVRLIEQWKQQSGQVTPPPETIFELGIAHFYLGEYRQAVSEMRSILSREDVSESYVGPVSYYLGAALIRLRQYEEGVEVLGRAVEGDHSQVLAAKLALTSAILASAPDELDTALRLTNELIDVARGLWVRNEKDPVAAEFLISALYNHSLVNSRIGHARQALEAQAQAEQLAGPEHMPMLLLNRAKLEPSEARSTLRRAVSAVVQERLRFPDRPKGDLAFNDRALAVLLARLLDAHESAGFDELLSYARVHLLPRAEGEAAILLAIFERGARSDDALPLLPLLRSAMADERREGASEALRLKIEKLLSMHCGEPERRIWIGKYAETIRKIQGYEPDQQDFYILVNESLSYINSSKLPEALRALEIFAPFEEKVLPVSRAYYFLMSYYNLNVFQRMNKREDALRVAREMIKHPAIGTPDGDAEAMSERLRDYAQQEIRSQFRDQLKRIGRNTKVLVRSVEGGDTFTAKFKSVSDDIASGKYVLIEPT